MHFFKALQGSKDRGVRLGLSRVLCSLPVLHKRMESSFCVEDASSAEQRTFRNDSRLPSLPIPSLDEALSKYLDSCKAVLNEDEFKKTKKIVLQFKTNQGPRLDKALVEKSKVKRNWLDEWWLDGYMGLRDPAGSMGISGVPTLSYWPIDSNLQVKSAALQLHFLMKFWSLIREERLKQQKDGKGNCFSMHQFRYMHNTCRIPRPQKDEIFNCFKTVNEGSCPSHVIVFHRQRLYKIEGVCHRTGKIYSAGQFHQIMLQIVCDTDSGPGIAALTELNRDTWAEARSHLIDLSSGNESNIHDIDTAVSCFSLCNRSLENENEMLHFSLVGSYGMRWNDKLNCLCSSNSKLMVYGDHSPIDGMVFVTFLAYVDALLQNFQRGEQLSEIWNEDPLPVESPTELTFVMDDKIKHWITDGMKVAEDIENNFDGTIFHFKHFGRSKLKKLNQVHPLAFVQLSIQLAYMRKHGKPAPTYETATTRMFFRGRTETVRSCTPEAVDFCNAMINGSSDKKELFLAACKKYMWLIKECKEAKGCDRYLLGLAAIANENGEQLPEIFSDPSFVKTGGNGNFSLSTSFLGYKNMAGCTFAMTEDGYGTYYRMNNDSMRFVITSYKSCQETSAKSMSEYLSAAMVDVYNLMVDHIARL